MPNNCIFYSFLTHFSHPLELTNVCMDKLMLAALDWQTMEISDALDAIVVKRW